jgi:hypothetical protein
MAYKTGFVVKAPDGNPKKNRASLKTAKIEITAVVCGFETDQLVDECKNLVQNEGVQALILCPGCTHEEVAKVVSSGMVTGQILAKEWFS